MTDKKENRDPYKGYVDIDLEGDERRLGAGCEMHKVHGIKVLNIENFGCIAVTWNRDKASSLSLPDVYASEVDGKFVLAGK